MKISCLGTVSFSFRDKMAMYFGFHFMALVSMLLTVPVSGFILASMRGSGSGIFLLFGVDYDTLELCVGRSSEDQDVVTWRRRGGRGK